MRTSKFIHITLISLSLFAVNESCKKQDDWLEVKRNKSDVVPSTLKDYQAILDNEQIMNQSLPGLGLLGSDNYYVTNTMWQSRLPVDRNGYVWKPDIFEGQGNVDWNRLYQIVEYANVVIDGLNEVTSNPDNQVDWNNVMGSALFFRAFAFYNVASLFAAPYDQSTASSDLGIPLSLSSYIGKKIKRSTVQESYDQILSDLHSAEELLPVKSVYQTRPSKTAVEALLARVYLNMGDYAKAGQYANVALSNYNTLTDYTTLPGTSNPLPKFPNNKEVIFWTIASTYSITSQTYAYVDSTLFSSYIDNDLRKTKWYSNAGGTLRRFQGSQAGSAGSFSGLAVNELFLIRAEAYARQSNPGAAMQDLNTLLKSRWKKVSGVSTYVDQTAIDAADALSKIVIERRKELPFIAPIRWDDLRRLNKDPKFARTLTRNLNGQIYTLAPNDNRYVYPIPADEIRLSGIEQNPR